MKNNKKFKKIFIGGMLIFAAMVCGGCGGENSKKPSDAQQSKEDVDNENTSVEDEANNENVSTEGKTVPEEKFPLPALLDSERLELISVFEFTGMNPDCENVYAEEIGAIQVKNVSGSYLETAELQITMSNGECLEYVVKDIPADMEVMAFELQNQVYDDTYQIEDVQVTAEYSDVNIQDRFAWSVEGSEITVENISDEDMKNVNVQYHCTIDGLSYGGTSYELEVGDLQPGESATVTDMFCFVGDVTVVNVTCE